MDTINVMLDEGAKMPTRGHADDAGFDLYTPTKQVVPARGCVAIDTGVHMEIPKGYVGEVETKSGLNMKHSIVALGGIIDAGYTGPIVVKVYNMSDVDYTFEAGDKIVQLVIQTCVTPTAVEVTSFDETERGNDGFGSTGR